LVVITRKFTEVDFHCESYKLTEYQTWEGVVILAEL